MDFYIIELQDRIKIGITTNFKRRIGGILTGSGIRKSDVLKLYHFENSSMFEGNLKRLFESHKVNGEWFFRKGLVEKFLNEIKDKNELSEEMIAKIQSNTSTTSDIDKAYEILKVIQTERKTIGYPKSVKVDDIIKKKKATYRNMVYHISDDYLTFYREPKFEFHDISNSNMIECLKIMRNNSKDLKRKSLFQFYIDDLFNKSNNHTDKIIKEIGVYFFDINTVETKSNDSVQLTYLKELDCYVFEKKYGDLEPEEYHLLKKSEETIIYIDYIKIKYKNKDCYCRYLENDYQRLINFFDEDKLKVNLIELEL